MFSIQYSMSRWSQSISTGHRGKSQGPTSGENAPLRGKGEECRGKKYIPHFPPQDLPQHPAVSSHADLGMRKVMHAVGGPYEPETVLRETDNHMGPDSQNISGKRCGGEARRADPKQKARYIAWSVAETFA